MSNLFTSSGGVGDLLIVGAKLSKFRGRLPKLLHFEKHQIQEKALKELMQRYIDIGLLHPESEVGINPQPYKTAISLVSAEECYPSKDQFTFYGGYVSTYCNENMNPYFLVPTPVHGNLSPYIVINCVAGRINDSTRRIIAANVVRQIKEIAPKYEIVLLSVTNEFPDIEGTIKVKTPTIIHAFAVLNECSAFIGQDGVLAYYAMMQEKPTYVTYHLEDLPNHYMHPNWKAKSVINIGPNIVTEIEPSHLDQFKKLLENPS